MAVTFKAADKEAVLKAQQEAINEINNPIVADNKEEETPDAPTIELTDEQIIELVNKRGIKLSEKKEEETISPEEKAKQEQLEEIEKLNFAVQNNLLTPERYNELKEIINTDGLELTKKEFAKSYKEQNKDATKEEIQNAYDDYYMVNKTTTETVIDEETSEEKVIEKNRFEEKFSKWGEQRIQTKAQRIKENAKSILDSLDTNFRNAKIYQAKANEYSKTVDDILKDIKPDAFKLKIVVGTEKPEEKNITVDLGADAHKEIQAYMITNIGGLVVGDEKVRTNKDELKKLIDGFVKTRYEQVIETKKWEIARGEGLRDGSAGIKTPIIPDNFTSDRKDDEDEKIAKEIPPHIKIYSKNLNKNKTK